MPTQDNASNTLQRNALTDSAKRIGALVLKIGLGLLGLAAAGLLALLMLVAMAMVVAYPNLPDVSDLVDYKPKLPLRVYTADGQLIGEFGEERRNLTPIKDIPQILKDAVLAVEDHRFYQHLARGHGQLESTQKPRGLHHHHASGTQCLLDV
jgi:penicillin-binding protein 1A